MNVHAIRLRCSMTALLLSVTGTAAASDANYLGELQARADSMQLSTSREWQVLLHYEDAWPRGGTQSTVTTTWFFNAADGATDARSELHATLAAFFRQENLKPRDEPAQCVFVARYQWLKSKLGFDATRLPEVECDRFQAWAEALNVGAVTMVFPAAYLNSPASMFGHTLLRLDPPQSGTQAGLLSYAVNFAAETEEENGLVFAVRGLTGGYSGSFGIYPYYEKVKEYARIENRDLWEYALLLRPDEIQSLLRHLWELRGVNFDYYFLKYNCSYQLLALLESARPSLGLVQQFRGWAIPTDTLRALRDVPGLVGEVAFRPALSTVLAHEASSLSPQQLTQSLVLSQPESALDAANGLDTSAQDKARMLQVAHDYLYYQYQAGRMSRDSALPRAREILLARSKLGGKAEFSPVPRPDTVPDEGHPTRRVSMSVVSEQGHAVLQARLRPAYHDLLDPDAGYGLGAQIRFLDLGVSIDLETADARLEDLRFVDIVSISPRDDVFKPISWRFGTGLRRPSAPLFEPDSPGLGLYFEGGPGLAWGSDQALVYFNGLASLDINHDLAHSHTAGLGVSAGMLMRPRREWGLLLELGTMERNWGDENHERWASIGQQWQFNSRFGLRLELEHRDTRENDWARLGLSGQWYF